MADAVLRLLPSERPVAFDSLPPAEQAWRGRVFLMTWSRGGDIPISWAFALHDEPTHNADMRKLVAEADDDLIRATVMARRDAEPDEGEIAPPVPLTTPARTSRPSPSTGDLFVERLLAESRARSNRPSRVSILVRPHRDGSIDEG